MSKCTECNEYDKEKFYCPKWCEVIKGTIEDARADERAKTIDEFAEKLKREHYALCALQDKENFQFPSYLLIDDVYRHIDKVAEELKDKKGGTE